MRVKWDFIIESNRKVEGELSVYIRYWIVSRSFFFEEGIGKSRNGERGVIL